MKQPASTRTQGQRALVMLVEDHPMLRKGLADCINEERDLITCGEAGSAREAMKLAAARKPDIAVVDISLPDGHGLELIKDLKAILPRLKILVLSMHEESVYAPRALRAGALGYIMKSEPPSRVIQAIRKVMRGEVYFSASQTGSLLLGMSDEPAKAAALEERLTDLEMEVFELIGRGADPKAIARQLRISLKTVLAHRENIKIKLRVRTAAKLAHVAFSWSRDH